MNSLGQNRMATAEAVNAVPRSRRRIGILALLAVGTMINYLDRTVLGIAAPQLTQELGIGAAVMGLCSPPLHGPMRWRKSPAACFSTDLVIK